MPITAGQTNFLVSKKVHRRRECERRQIQTRDVFTHRRDDLAGLADLHIVWHEAGVDGGAGGAHVRVQLVGQLVQQLEVLPGFQAAAWRREARGEV